MPTVPQPYVYPVANITGAGAGFTSQMSDHLLYLLGVSLESFHGVIGSDETNVTITGDFDLDTTQKSTLDALVNRAADYFAVTTDGGTTPLSDPIVISKAAGLASSTTITLRYKSGDGNNSNGFGETVDITAPLMPINKLGGVFDGTGKFAFTVGASLDRGTSEIDVVSDSLPTRHITVTWT